MPSTIYLNISTGGRRSTAELNLSRDDIRRLYDKEFKNVCPMCHGALGDSEGDVCCACFRVESRFHSDCCLAEEEDQCPI